MANTKRRTNVSLNLKLFKEATAYGKENGISLSALIEQGLRLRLAEPVLIEQTNLAPAPLPDRDEIRGWLIEILPDMIRGTLLPPEGAELVRAAHPLPNPTTSTTPPSRTVDVPQEVRERLNRFTVLELVGATGMDRTNLSRFRSGNRSRVSQETLNRLVEGLTVLENPRRTSP